MLNITSALLLIAATGPCNGTLGSVGNDPVTCEQLPHPAYAAANKGQFCSDVNEALRRKIIVRSLRDANALPTETQTEAILKQQWPSYEVVNARVKAQNEKLNAMARAFEESERDPLNDHALWQEKIAKYASYEEWVQFRTMLARQANRPAPPAPVGLTREEYEAEREDLRAKVVEAFFQRWVRTVWSPKQRERTEAAWSAELSDAFFAKAMTALGVKRNASIECGDLSPNDFRQLSLESLFLKEMNP